MFLMKNTTLESNIGNVFAVNGRGVEREMPIVANTFDNL